MTVLILLSCIYPLVFIFLGAGDQVSIMLWSYPAMQVTYVDTGKFDLPISFAVGGDSDTSPVV